MKYIATIVAAIALASAASAELFYYVGQGGANLQSPASYRVGSRDGAEADRLPGGSDYMIVGGRYTTNTNEIEIAAEDVDFISGVYAISLRTACNLTVNVATNSRLGCAISYINETTGAWAGRVGKVEFRLAPGVELHLDAYRRVVASGFAADYLAREFVVSGGGSVYLCDDQPQSANTSGYLGIVTVGEESSLALGSCFKNYNLDGLEGAGTFTSLRSAPDGGTIYIASNNNRPHDFSGFLNLPHHIFRLNYDVTQNLLGAANVISNFQFHASGNVLGFGVGNAQRDAASSVGTKRDFVFGYGLTNAIRYAGTGTGIWGKMIYFYNGDSVIDAGNGVLKLGADGASDGYMWRNVRSDSKTAAAKGAARLVFDGDGTCTNFWQFGIYNKDGTTSDLPVAVVKKGTCTWRDVYKKPNELTGVFAVDEGTLQFNTLEPAGTECALGTGTLLYDPDYSSVTMPIDETKRVGYQLRIGGGDRAGTLEYIGKADVVNDSRVVAVNGEGTLKNSSGKSFQQFGIVTAGAGDHRLTLDGIAVAGDITNSVGTLSIVKAGAGTSHLGGSLKLNGTLEAREGRMVVGSPRTFTFFKLIVKENMSHCFCTERGQGGYGGFENAARFDELSFYDADGVRHGLHAHGATAAAVANIGENEWKVVVGSASGLYGSAENIFDGVFSNTTTGVTSPAGIASPRNTSSQGSGTMANPTPPSTEKGYYREEPSSWSEFVVRLPLDTPEIVSFDFLLMAGTNGTWYVATPRVFELQGSADGVAWHTLFTMDDLNAYQLDNNLEYKSNRRWASTGVQPALDAISDARKLSEGNGFGFIRRAYDNDVVQDFSQVQGVAVAPGAELSLEGFTAADKINRIVVESAAAGMGKLEFATLAATGTLEIGEVPAEGSFDVAADLSGVANPAALAGWTVKAGGQVKAKWSARITATGIHVSKPGTSLFFR